MAHERQVMQTKSPALLPILRSDALGRILAFLFTREEAATSLSRLAERLDLSPSTVKREIDQLEEAGLVGTAREGRNRTVVVDASSPLYPELKALILKAFGPAPALRDALSRVEGAEEAYVFGSWARRNAGEPGLVPRDVDVVVIGEPDPNDVYAACADVERRVQQAINPTIVTRDDWDATATPFLTTVRRGPLVPVLP